MTTLHLGVVEYPYSYIQSPPKVAKASKKPRKARAVKSGEQTTGDVASFLEDKYHIMEVFFEEKGQEIADAMAEALMGSLENVMLGAPITGDIYASANSKIDDAFKKWLSAGEIEQIGIPGVPTKAALEGVSHRFKQKHGPRRPSFVDTGLYENSFWAWVT